MVNTISTSSTIQNEDSHLVSRKAWLTFRLAHVFWTSPCVKSPLAEPHLCPLSTLTYVSPNLKISNCVQSRSAPFEATRRYVENYGFSKVIALVIEQRENQSWPPENQRRPPEILRWRTNVIVNTRAPQVTWRLDPQRHILREHRDFRCLVFAISLALATFCICLFPFNWALPSAAIVMWWRTEETLSWKLSVFWQVEVRLFA